MYHGAFSAFTIKSIGVTTQAKLCNESATFTEK